MDSWEYEASLYNYDGAYFLAVKEIERLRKALRKAAEDLDMDAGPPAFGAEAIVAHYLERADVAAEMAP